MIAETKELFKQLQVQVSDLKSNTAGLGCLEHSVKTFQESVKNHASKLIDIEDRSRRSNVVIHGILEEPNETESDLKRKVITETLENRLGVKCISIGRIHRLGRTGSKRPVIMFLQDYNEKVAIFKNVSKLKGSNIFVQNDYSHVTLKKRKLLWESAKHDKSLGKKVSLQHDKLRIDNDVFIWNETTNQREITSGSRANVHST